MTKVVYYEKRGIRRQVTSEQTWLWVMLFGPFYFVHHGLYKDAIFQLFMLIYSLGFATFIVPFFVQEMVEFGYEAKDWYKVE